MKKTKSNVNYISIDTKSMALITRELKSWKLSIFLLL